MSDYPVQRLRLIGAKLRSEIANERTVAEDAADEIVRLRADNEKLRAATTPICVGRRIIGILAKEGAWTSENGASVIAADELFQRDPYDEIEKLRAALKEAAILLAKAAGQTGEELFADAAIVCAAAAKETDNEPV